MERRWISIGEASELVGVSAATIRSWESRYGWPTPARTKGSHRRYAASSVAAFVELAELRRRMGTRQALDHLGLRRETSAMHHLPQVGEGKARSQKDQ